MPENTTIADAVGTVVHAHGQVRAESGIETRVIKIGDPIFQGDVLITDEGGGLEVEFNDKTALSQGENSEISVDSYVYNPTDPAGSDLLLQMTKGVFRTVTGEIADQNPDQFQLKSPLATIGIRGTTVVSEVGGLTEKHGVEDIGPGKVLVVRDAMGNIQFIDAPTLIVDIMQGQAIKAARPLTDRELEHFKSTAPLTTQGEEAPESDEETEAEDEADVEGEGKEVEGEETEETAEETEESAEEAVAEEEVVQEEEVVPEEEVVQEEETVQTEETVEQEETVQTEPVQQADPIAPVTIVGVVDTTDV
ncbi:MAG: FecR domain-containing protein, partial [Desulfobacterales bacterium]|nr:FecR domain-containing protein [Desulfobacterales bacterium]